MPTFRALACLSLASVALAAATTGQQPLSFEYDRTTPLDVKETSARKQGPVSVREITYAGASGTRNGATLVTPASSAQRAPGILFVHWYGPPAPTSNRTQFVPDAVALGAKGAVSLLIDTPWSNPDYMKLRARDRDFAQSIAQVKELRRALDVLLAQPSVDAARVAFVGHDFGAMYGTLAAVNDPRVSAFVFMAGTAAFSDWFLFGQPRLQGAARQAFIDHMAPLDPVAWLPKLRGPLLLQFAKEDEYVPPATMERLIAAAPRGHEVLTYAGGHELNDPATKDRIAWLTKTLGLR
jgi:dienelactone hydrolase